MYTELLLRPASMADQRIYPLDARRLVATALDGEPVREACFGRQVWRAVSGHKQPARRPTGRE